jgi:hypothetical protein
MMNTSSTGTSISQLRQHYRPAPDRIPVWLRRVWHWF